MKLQEQTEQLLKECESCKNRFFRMREQNVAPDFFQEVKPHANMIHELLTDWQKNVVRWLKEYKPKYFHEQQIESVVEAMNQFVVQSFYKETSKKRFLQSIHSVHYTLSSLLRYLNEGNGKN